MNRREFLVGSIGAGAAVLACGYLPVVAAAVTADPKRGRFRLNYAPHFGMFRHHAGADLVDQVKFMADEGFLAVEDNGLKSKPSRIRERIRREMDRHGMQMGQFVATAEFGTATFASGRPEHRERVVKEIRDSIAVAQSLDVKWISVVPGRRDPRLPLSRQTAHAVDTLSLCAELCEHAGVVMLLEPIDHGRQQPRLFLHSVRQAQQICRAVGSRACKILFDCYQQQLAAERHSPRADMFSLIERSWSNIGYLQIGDNPGRKEPGTGCIDYGRILRFIEGRGFDGLIGMEHGNSLPGREGERAVIDAYAALDRR